MNNDLHCRDLHALGFLYLASAHSTDGELDPREMRVIAERLAGWAGLDDDEVFESALKASVDLYRACASPEARLQKIAALVEEIESTASRTDLEHVLADLIEIAQADGRVVAGEIDFVQAVARTFGVEVQAGEPVGDDAPAGG